MRPRAPPGGEARLAARHVVEVVREQVDAALRRACEVRQALEAVNPRENGDFMADAMAGVIAPATAALLSAQPS